MKNWIIATLLTFSSVVSANSSFTEGKDFTELKQADSRAPKLQLICRYRSDACQTVIEGLVESSIGAVTLLPIVLREAWRDEAKLMLMANELGFTIEQHLKLSQLLSNPDVQISSSEDKASLLSQLMPKLEQEIVEAVVYSSELPKQLKQVNKQLKSYPISSVPTIIYQGRYTIDAHQGKTTRRILEIIDYLRTTRDAVSTD